MDPDLVSQLVGPAGAVLGPAGVAGVIIAYMLRRDVKQIERNELRETQQNERVERMENGIREKLETLVEGSTVAVTENTVVMRQVSESLKNIRCLSGERRGEG